MAGAPLDPRIGIGAVDVPTYLRRPEIVSMSADARLLVTASDRWGENLQAGIGRALAGDLARLVPTAQVFQEPFPTASQPAFAVALQVQRFEPVVDGAVELDAHWMLTDGAHRHAAPTLRLESIREPISDATTEARIAAMSRAMAQLAARIATEIRAVLAARTVAWRADAVQESEWHPPIPSTRQPSETSTRYGGPPGTQNDAPPPQFRGLRAKWETANGVQLATHRTAA